MLRFSIEKWEACAPDISDHKDWFQWAMHPYCPSLIAPPPNLPDVSFLPAIQRRRLSPLARMVFSCAWPLASTEPPMPMIFASRHGETSRSFQLLQTVSAQETLSPTSFALSVHNAIVGQWSIIRKETQETIALTGDEDMLEHAIQEACLLINAGAPRVLIVLAEERPPPAYEAWITDVPFSYAIALQISAGNEWQISLTSPSTGQTPQPWPNPLNLLQRIILKTPSWHHDSPRRQWHWQHLATHHPITP